MAQVTTLPIVGALALVGVGAGIHLGHSALAEINPVYYTAPPTRFHSDLVANPPTGSPPQMALAQSEDAAALGTGCIGCRTYPEEYYPVHDASLNDEPVAHAGEGDKVRVAVVEEQPDPEALRLREDIQRVERYAGDMADPDSRRVSAPAPAEAGTPDEASPVTD